MPKGSVWEKSVAYRVSFLSISAAKLGLALAVAVSFAIAGGSTRMAIGAETPVNSTQSSIDTATLATPVSRVEVSGFRSAKFGMTEAEVRAAIAADFGLDADAIPVGENTVERTRILTIAVGDLLEGGGTAEVSYVLGYTSQALIQVGVSWAASADGDVDANRLAANGDVLSNYFLGAGYVPETIRTGLVLDSGILLFRGEDAQGHATILLLQGQMAANADGKQVLTPASLALLYAANPDAPDVFKLSPSQF